jgi:hypothetical protein
MEEYGQRPHMWFISTMNSVHEVLNKKQFQILDKFQNFTNNPPDIYRNNIPVPEFELHSDLAPANLHLDP